MPLDLLSIAEVAKLLNVSRQQVAKYIEAGRIKAVTIAGRRFVERKHAKKPPANKPGPKSV